MGETERLLFGVFKAVPVIVIEVKNRPTRKSTLIGENFDKSGLTVEKVMSDGTKIPLKVAKRIRKRRWMNRAIAKAQKFRVGKSFPIR